MNRRLIAAAFAPVLFLHPVLTPGGAAQSAAPTAHRCDSATSSLATPGITPVKVQAAGHDMNVMAADIDLAYIDMMIPHHASIIAMADVAVDRLTDPRLQAIAAEMTAIQSAEADDLRALRERLFGGAEPMPMDAGMMDAMSAVMPGLGDPATMAMLMDPAAMVSAYCAGLDPDLAFIDLTIPHHQMAVDASRQTLAQTAEPEVAAIAERVVRDQTAEIAELEQLRAELMGADGTPVP